MTFSVAELTCPNRRRHTMAPVGYLEWSDWAEMKSKSHYQVRCSGCGLFTIWKRKPKTHNINSVQGEKP